MRGRLFARQDRAFFSRPLLDHLLKYGGRRNGNDDAEEPADLGALPMEAPAPAGAADSGIAAQMLLALDKYQALARERGLGSAPPPVPAAGTLYDGRL